jgi:hypothetical protein
MTHRIVVNCETGVVSQVEYTAEEQAAHDAAVVAEALALAEAQALAESQTTQQQTNTPA